MEVAEGLDRLADITSKCDLEILCVECDVRLQGIHQIMVIHLGDLQHSGQLFQMHSSIYYLAM